MGSASVLQRLDRAAPTDNQEGLRKEKRSPGLGESIQTSKGTKNGYVF